MGWLQSIFGKAPALPGPGPSHDGIPTFTIEDMQASSGGRLRFHDGEKFPGGLGPVDVLVTDYWALRARSAALFKSNVYARGLIRRLVDNEINTGLHLEAIPEEGLLGYEEDGLADWTETTESLFGLWANGPSLCDDTEQSTFGALQASARREALVAGDVLTVLVQDPITKLPRVRLINGAAVRTPMNAPSDKNIQHGVELDDAGRHVAYWIAKSASGLLGLESERLPAYGPKTGRRMAWLVYGSDKRLGEVRGEPLLSLVLQSLKEIDRYRESVQRKAVLTSHVALFVTKSEDGPSTRPLTGGGAVRVGTDKAVDTTGVERTYNVTESIPGYCVDTLATGETINAFPSTGTDEKFGDFEAAIVSAIAWGNGVPPEILTLSFNKSYSASQAGINEFKQVVDCIRMMFGQSFCDPIYREWLLSQALSRRLEMPGFVDAWRDKSKYETYWAWATADWSGHVKPAVDVAKNARGMGMLIEMGLITRDRAARQLTGMKFSKVAKQLRRENKQLREANAELEPEEPAVTPGQPSTPKSVLAKTARGPLTAV